VPVPFPTAVRPPEPEPIETYTEPEPAMTYLPEEAFADASVGFADAMDFAPETVPGTTPYEPAEEFGNFDPSPLDSADVLDEAPMEAGLTQPAVEPADELLGMTDDEADTLGASPDATIMFSTPPPAATWATDSTMEVSLEDRAAASVEAQAASMFEVFEDETLPPPVPEPPTLDLPSKSVPVVAAPPPPEPPPGPALITEEPEVAASFAEVAPPPPAVAQTPESVAAAVAVPMEMVEQIAQRVVAQISEKVVRDVAWEVIPDLAEALIKKEIERLKAELLQT
jgi:hypothetical protein